MSNCPVGESATVTAFGVGGWPGDGFRLEACGRPVPLGQIVRYVNSVASTVVTFSETPVAVSGIPTQSPGSPWTVTVTTSPGPNGDDFDPTVEVGRVSRIRHGETGTKADAPDGDVARTIPIPPAPDASATAAPTAAQRARETSFVRSIARR